MADREGMKIFLLYGLLDERLQDEPIRKAVASETLVKITAVRCAIGLGLFRRGGIGSARPECGLVDCWRQASLLGR